jgi:hypothetical protein
METMLISGFTSYFGIWYTSFKSLSTILAVPPYREAFLRPFTMFWRDRGDEEVKVINGAAFG